MPMFGSSAAAAATPADLLSGDRLFGNPDWTAPTAQDRKASPWGGRATSGGRRLRLQDRHALALLSRKALVYNGASTAGLTEVASSDPYYGDVALQLDTTSLTTHSIRPVAVLPRPCNLTGRIVRFTYKPIANVSTRVDAFSIRLYSTGDPSQNPADYHQFANSGLVKDTGAGNTNARWTAMGVPITMFTAVGNGADLTAITWAMVTIKSASGSLSIQIGGLDDYPNPLTRAQVIFSFDDAMLVQAREVAELFAGYGFPAVLFPSPLQASVGVNDAYFYHVNHMRAVQDQLGWQLASQAYSTESAAVLDAMTEDQATVEIAKLRRAYAAQGFEGGHDGSFFSGVGWTDVNPIVNVLRRNFRTLTAFYNGAGSGNPFVVPETFPFADPYRVRRLNAQTWNVAGTGAGSSIERNLAAIQLAQAHKGVHVAGYHNVGSAPGATDYDALKAQLDYCDANRATINVTTFDALYERVGL